MHVHLYENKIYKVNYTLKKKKEKMCSACKFRYTPKIILVNVISFTRINVHMHQWFKIIYLLLKNNTVISKKINNIIDQ